MGLVMEKLGFRKVEMVNMILVVNGYIRLEFKVLVRGFIGFRNEFMIDIKGNGIMNYVFDSYEKYKGEILGRSRGLIVLFEVGDLIVYGLYNV